MPIGCMGPMGFMGPMPGPIRRAEAVVRSRCNAPGVARRAAESAGVLRRGLVVEVASCERSGWASCERSGRALCERSGRSRRSRVVAWAREEAAEVPPRAFCRRDDRSRSRSASASASAASTRARVVRCAASASAPKLPPLYASRRACAAASSGAR